MDFLVYILAGAGVGLAVGLTGVGGGSLMTPLLILYGIPEKIAIGTDLLYAALTKTGAMASHAKRNTVRWSIVLALAAGSLPAALITAYGLKHWVPADADYGAQLTTVLGVMLIVTAIVVFFRKKIAAGHNGGDPQAWYGRPMALPITFGAGLLLGVCVTLSSVGAGAFCAALLMWLYPRMPSLNIVGTDIAHAVPLTLVAGLGHLWVGNVDFMLLGGLLIGSLPAVHLGSVLAYRVPNSVLQPILASLLLVIGLRFVFFGSAH